jgi:hypothetical protein
LTPNQKQFNYTMSYPTLNEGFTNLADLNGGQSAPFSVTKETPVDTSSWFTPNLTYGPGHPPSARAEDIMNRPPQPVPLPEGELLLFANTPFKPECCPTAYSNSSGCACITTKDGPNGMQSQYNFLISRGGNNVPYSEY